MREVIPYGFTLLHHLYYWDCQYLIPALSSNSVRGAKMANISNRSKSQGDKALPNRPSPPKILVVDDDFITRNLLIRIINEIGIHVDSAEGGLAAKKCLQKAKYSVMITDLKMPGMDGYALSCWLKRNAPDVKVVMMTGCQDSEIEDYQKSDVVDDWIIKPFNVNDIFSVLRKLMPAEVPNIQAKC